MIRFLRKNQGGKTSRYLDIYHKGQRHTEYLSLYLHPQPKTKTQKEENKTTRALAQKICLQRQVEEQNNTFGFRTNQQAKGSFLSYMRTLAQTKQSSPGTYGCWMATIKYLETFCPKDLAFRDIDSRFLLKFKAHLTTLQSPKTGRKISPNAQYTYLCKIKAALKQAVKDKILTTDPSQGLPLLKREATQKEFLTLEELQALVKTPCELPQMKTAFLFSCLTGLRWSDIQQRCWSDVHHSEVTGPYLRFTQQKTKQLETLPIATQALQLLGPRQEPTAPLIPNLTYTTRNTLKLKQWVKAAGITKKITFHCARHTYATLQLSLGTNLYTVSKLLGHKNLHTTQVYTKIIDEDKRAAANRIQIDL